MDIAQFGFVALFGLLMGSVGFYDEYAIFGKKYWMVAYYLLQILPQKRKSSYTPCLMGTVCPNLPVITDSLIKDSVNGRLWECRIFRMSFL